jgi:putative transposase
MANTYTQIHIQAVFTVTNRDCVISNKWSTELYKYIAGIIQNNGHKVLAISGMSDHVHALFGMRPSQSVSDLLQDIKGCSSKWINENRFVKGKFSWQEGYGAFSYSRRELPAIINYINQQQIHHRTKTFYDEYIELLKEFEIDYKNEYIFKPVSVDYSVPDGT